LIPGLLPSLNSGGGSSNRNRRRNMIQQSQHKRSFQMKHGSDKTRTTMTTSDTNENIVKDRTLKFEQTVDEHEIRNEKEEMRRRLPVSYVSAETTSVNEIDCPDDFSAFNFCYEITTQIEVMSPADETLNGALEQRLTTAIIGAMNDGTFSLYDGVELRPITQAPSMSPSISKRPSMSPSLLPTPAVSTIVATSNFIIGGDNAMDSDTTIADITIAFDTMIPEILEILSCISGENRRKLTREHTGGSYVKKNEAVETKMREWRGIQVVGGVPVMKEGERRLLDLVYLSIDVISMNEIDCPDDSVGINFCYEVTTETRMQSPTDANTDGSLEQALKTLIDDAMRDGTFYDILPRRSDITYTGLPSFEISTIVITHGFIIGGANTLNSDSTDEDISVAFDTFIPTILSSLTSNGTAAGGNGVIVHNSTDAISMNDFDCPDDAPGDVIFCYEVTTEMRLSSPEIFVNGTLKEDLKTVIDVAFDNGTFQDGLPDGSDIIYSKSFSGRPPANSTGLNAVPNIFLPQ